jgi:hypothetical protein
MSAMTICTRNRIFLIAFIAGGFVTVIWMASCQFKDIDSRNVKSAESSPTALSCPEGVAQTPSANLAGTLITAYHSLVDTQGVAGTSGRVVDVTAYGAVGNGSTNDVAAIQNAINALNTGDTLLIPSGKTYAVGSSGWPGLRVFDKNRIKIIGTGATLRTLTVPSGAWGSQNAVLIVERCTSCEVQGLSFDNNRLGSGAVGVNASTGSIFRSLTAKNGLGRYEFWSVAGQDNQWLSNRAIRTNPSEGDGYGFYLGNTNVGFEEINLTVIGNSTYRNKWDGYVLMAKGVVAVGNTAIDNTWSSMISPGWIENPGRDHVVIGNYLKGALNHEYQVDIMPDGSYLQNLVLFGNWLNSSGSGSTSTGAYLNQAFGVWAVANKVTDANHSGFQITGSTRHVLVKGNAVRDTRSKPNLPVRIRISPYTGPATEDITIVENPIRNAKTGIGVGANGDNGGTRNRILIDRNYGEGNGQNIVVGSGPGVSVGSWLSSAPPLDGSKAARSSLSSQLPQGTLKSLVDGLLAKASTFSDSICTMPSTTGDYEFGFFSNDGTKLAN